MSKLNVILIDDSLADRRAIKSLLRQVAADISVTEVESVAAAYLNEGRSFDAVYLENNLADASGLGSLEEIRELWPNAALFLMTASGDANIAKQAILNGATDYLVKSELSDVTFASALKTGIVSAKKRHRIEEQHADIATFVEVLVHDFRAPIRATAYLSEQIAEDLEYGETEEVRVGLQLLRRSATQMTDMIKSLSDHVRFDRDTHSEYVEVGSVLRQAMEPFQVEIENASAKVAMHLEPNLPKLPCYPPQIAQVLQNLIGNALKYRGDRPPVIEISAKQTSPGHILLSVSDRGPGIPEEYSKRIFEPFKRLPGTGDISGTGLGLATCKKIVLRHGGQITCRSEVGVGTEISFRLPLDAEQSPLWMRGQSETRVVPEKVSGS